jgi:hypothetical protein
MAELSRRFFQVTGEVEAGMELAEGDWVWDTSEAGEMFALYDEYVGAGTSPERKRELGHQLEQLVKIKIEREVMNQLCDNLNGLSWFLCFSAYWESEDGEQTPEKAQRPESDDSAVMDEDCGCPDVYYCPTTYETECPRHGGFDVCCDHPEVHIPGRIVWVRVEDGVTVWKLD